MLLRQGHRERALQPEETPTERAKEGRAWHKEQKGQCGGQRRRSQGTAGGAGESQTARVLMPRQDVVSNLRAEGNHQKVVNSLQAILTCIPC